jgi:hypothetical protein
VPPGYGPGGWPGAPGPPKRSRAKIIIPITVVTVVVGLALIAGSIVFLGRKSLYPEAWDPRVVDITNFVQSARGLDYKHPVYVDFLSDDDFNKKVTGPDSSSLSDAEKQQLQDSVATFRALGLIQGDVDLAAQSNQLQQSSVLAFYSPETKHVYVRGTDLDIPHKVTLAHELTHALQDQYFDLTRLDQLPTQEEKDAFRTMAEGDAVRIQNQYVDQLSAADQKTYHDQYKSEADQAKSDTASVADVLVASQSTPYLFGPPFLELLHAQGGNTDINNAFDNPPPNMAQIADPEDFIHGQTPAKPADPDVPAGASKISEQDPDHPDQPPDDHLGSLQFFMMLSARVDPHLALQALDVWNGDAFVRYRQGSTLCAKTAIAVDDAAAAAKVGPILDQWKAAMPTEANAAVDTNGTTFTITSCDPGKDADMKITGKPSEALALPTIRLTIWAAALKGKVSEQQASCIARTFTDQIPMDEATSDNPDETDITNRISEAKAACV